MEKNFTIIGKQIGDRNIFEVRSRLQGDITVQNGCVFGSKTVYTQPGAIPDKTVIYTQVILPNLNNIRFKKLVFIIILGWISSKTNDISITWRKFSTYYFSSSYLAQLPLSEKTI